MPITIAISPRNLTQEGRDLKSAAEKRADRVLIVDPHKTWCFMFYSPSHAVVYHDGEDISNIDVFAARGSKGYGASLALLSAALEINGCKVIDPYSRYSIGMSNKIKTGIERFKAKVGIESGFAFDRNGAIEMLTMLKKSQRFPIVIKPIDGKRSRGRVVVKTLKRAKKLANDFFDTRTNDDYPFFVQVFEDIAEEYRVILIDGKAIACVRKQKTSQTARGSEFVVPDKFDVDCIARFAEQYLNTRGIYGADIAVNKDRRIFIVEANRAPVWKRVQNITNVNIGDAIFAHILDEKSLDSQYKS